MDGPAALNVWLIAGNETNPIVVSRNTANTARPVDVSTTHGLCRRSSLTTIVSNSPTSSSVAMSSIDASR